MKETFDMIEKFRKDYELRLSPGTLRNYVYDLNCFFNYMQKGYEAIKSSDVREWLKNMMNDGLKPSTIVNKICCLKSFYKYLLEEELVNKSPVDNIKLPKVDNSPPFYLEREQLQRLRELTKDDPLERALVETMYATGVRVSELINIKLDDIDWQSRKIIIRDGKGQKERVVLFSNECEMRIKEYLKNRREDSQYLFLGKQGKPMYRFLLNYYFRKYSKKLGFKITPNTMRHTFAAHLAEKGMPFLYIQALLGHDSPETTRIYARLYSHVRKKKYDLYM